MTAVALTVAEDVAVQLAPQPVVDSRVAIDPSTELTGDTMRSPSSPARARTRSVSSTRNVSSIENGHAEHPMPSLAPPASSGMNKEAAAATTTTAQLSPSESPSRVTQRRTSNAHCARATTPPPPRSSSKMPDHFEPSLLAPTTPTSAPRSASAAQGNGVRAGSPTPSLTVNGSASGFSRSSTARTSTASAVTDATSNSSFAPATGSQLHLAGAAAAPSSATNDDSAQTPRASTSTAPPSPSPESESDPTAALIQNLYARLDAQGVPGDGWDEGLERSRDGIINREAADGPLMTQNRAGKQTLSPQDAEKEEDRVLKRVDRYGFFSSSHPAALASQHNRLATLAASSYSTLPFNKRLSKAIKAGPSISAQWPSTQNNDNRRQSVLSIVTPVDPAAIALETKRIDKWAEMLRIAQKDAGGNAVEWDLAPGWWDGREKGGGKYRRLQRRVFKGVPDRWRRAVWGLEMERTAKEEQRRGRSNVRSLEQLKKEYLDLLGRPSTQDVQIDLDVPRTISGHVLFHTRYGQGQRALFHVLHTFGLSCEDIGGYCQGMGPIAATLLCYFEPERAYAALVRLFDQYHLRHIFEPEFTGLMETFYVQERLVEWLMPEVHKAFSDHMISTSAYATKWYITLFANSVPFATQLRLWDGLLLEGLDFLVIVAVAIIWSFKGSFATPSASFESILSSLSSYFFVESDDALLRWIRKTLRMKDVRKKMRTWRTEWQGFVQDGTADRRVT